MILAVLVLTAIFLVGTIGYRTISNGESSWTDCAYMTLITLASVGYGEITVHSDTGGGRVFTMFMIVCGISVYLYFLSTITAFLVEGDLLKNFWRKKMDKVIQELNGHYILCGIGETGIHITREFIETKRKIVVVEKNSARLQEVGSELLEKLLWIEGDSTNDEVLIKAGIKRASGLMACVAEDKDNLLITLSARQLNENMRIISRCKDSKMIGKLIKSGADSVVSPNFIGGMRIASEMVRPAAVGFMDIMLRDKDQNLRVEEIDIPDNSRVIAKTIGEVDFLTLAGLYPVAIQTPESKWVYNPSPKLKLQSGMKIIIIGNAEQRQKIEAIV
ncbi:MAG: Voltage-gated potassium channel Kch [Pelotomaculum sp. PtaB.Bin013]|uniref:Potassium channel protein n=1 Tax=Pelotomaculum isophthalicicum JI TaxID=947010 RepID=A0A9X4H0M6_9FIRM|nr:potassium channel protein [Pelotomaculum isophthalicicum]MDF9409950.1 potassium channel protein [Pelotomaculum isophthalicicum JI]OPX91120.1 MAG: Voltage-gated potassium channel Kch [Pelotomaculum sp. PtaB.Bin013]